MKICRAYVFNHYESEEDKIKGNLATEEILLGEEELQNEIENCPVNDYHLASFNELKELDMLKSVKDSAYKRTVETENGYYQVKYKAYTINGDTDFLLDWVKV